jgi:hypothetical protein
MKNTLFACLLLFATTAFAQNNNTSSPYTRYGYGQLSDNGLAAQRGMGGIGYGLRNSKLINPLNPASYSAVDSMTFMLDLGLTGQISWVKIDNLTGNRVNAGLDYLAVQFPLAKGLGFGVGLEPVSFVGYQYGSDSVTLSNGVIAPETYYGSGGLNKVYATLSYKIANNFSAGLKIGYVFGNIYHNGLSYNIDNGATLGYPSPWNDSLQLRGLNYEIGLQYLHKLSNNAELTFGAVYSPKIKLNSVYSQMLLNPGDSAYTHSTDYGFELPETYGLGVTYHQPKQGWTVGIDGKYQRWANAQYFSQTNVLQDRLKINAGAEYAHKLIYRAGAYYSNSYVQAEYQGKNHGYDEYGVSLGLGIPMVDRRSLVNFAFEYSMIRPEIKTSLDEKYLKFTVSYTFNELWFYKRKLQ